MVKFGTKKHGLKSNFIFNFASQILVLIIPLITTPYLARVLQETGNGQYSYAASIITYFTLFASLGFNTYGQRQIASVQNNKEEKSKIFWEIFISKSILTCISVAALYAISFSVGFGENYTKIILILSIQVISIPFDIQYLYKGDEDFALVAIRQIILRLVGLICVFVFVREPTDTWKYALCVSCSTIFSNLTMWTTLPKRIGIVKIKALKLFRHLKPMMLIFLPALTVTVYSVFDKTMIGLLANNPDYENGCYEQAYKLNSVAILLVTVISSVMVSRNAHDYSEGNFNSVKQHIYSAGNYTWMMGLPLIAGFAVLSGNLSSWFLGDGYVEVPLLLQIMSIRFVVSGFSEVFGNQLFLAIHKEKYMTIATAVAAVVNITLNYFLIQYWGAVGAAITTAVSEFLVVVILACFVAKYKYVSIGKIILGSWKYLLSAIIMGAVIYLIQRYLSYSVWTFLLITLIGVIIYALSLLCLRDKFFLRFIKQASGFIKSKFKRNSNLQETNEASIETADNDIFTIEEVADEIIDEIDEDGEQDQELKNVDTQDKAEDDNV